MAVGGMQSYRCEALWSRCTRGRNRCLELPQGQDWTRMSVDRNPHKNRWTIEEWQYQRDHKYLRRRRTVVMMATRALAKIREFDITNQARDIDTEELYGVLRSCFYAFPECIPWFRMRINYMIMPFWTNALPNETSVAHTDQVVCKLFHRVGGHSGLHRLRIMSDEYCL